MTENASGLLAIHSSPFAFRQTVLDCHPERSEGGRREAGRPNAGEGSAVRPSRKVVRDKPQIPPLAPPVPGTGGGAVGMTNWKITAKSEERIAKSEERPSKQLRIIRISRINRNLLISMPAGVPAWLRGELREHGIGAGDVVVTGIIVFGPAAF
jgi:hypothetical protein